MSNELKYPGTIVSSRQDKHLINSEDVLDKKFNKQVEDVLYKDVATSAEFDTSNYTINLKAKNGDIISRVDATPFTKDGMVDSVFIDNGYLVIRFNADANKQDIRITLSDIFDSTKYYTKTEIDGEINPLKEGLRDTNSWLDDVATDVNSHETQLSAIEGKIPSEASSSNKLADKNFVNSSVATNTATFQGTYRLHDDLGVQVTQSEPDAPIEYDKSATATALAQQISGADNNDYCFVVVPVSNTTGADTAYIDRFKYNGTAWSYEYTLNNSGFTAEQWAVINSGVAFEKGTGANSVKLKGDSNTASGEGAVTFGCNRSTAAGIRSFSHGDSVFAEGNYSHAEGQRAQASGEASHAEGFNTVASASYSHAEGQRANATKVGAHAEGQNTTASGQHSHAEGGDTRAIAQYSHAEGSSTEASGYSSHAEGTSSRANASCSHAEGYGALTLKGGDYSHAEGNGSMTNASSSHAEGCESYTFGSYSHAEGVGTTTIGSGSHSEGEGSGCVRLGQITSNPIDHNTFRINVGGDPVQVYKGDIVSNDSSFLLHRAIVTEDSYGFVIHVDYHNYLQADTIYIARGTSSGTSSHSEGKDTKARGDYSHAEGNMTYTQGQYSHAEGMYTETTNTAEHASGKYNKSNQGTIHSVGVGTSVDDRKNAFEIDDSGNVYIKNVGGYDGTNPSANVSIQNFLSNIILDGYTIDDTISTPYHGTVTIKKDNQPVSGADLYNTLKGYWDKGKVPVLKILLSSATASYNLPMYYQPIVEMASHLVLSNDVVIGLRISSTGVANLVLNSVTNLFT